MDRAFEGPADVRQLQNGELARLLRSVGARDRAHHVERSQMQERGDATYFVAWDDDRPCGRVTLFHRSKYEKVREILGDFPEMNALEATPQGAGIGSQLIASAEDRAKAAGARRIGLAVEPQNEGARRLYERLGYVEWKHGELVDEWLERGIGGEVIRRHADPCTYLVKDLNSPG